MTANWEDEDAMTLSAREEAKVLVTVGVDTHLDEHVAVALDQLGRRPDDLSVPTTEVGYAKLLGWAESLGRPERVGIEGAGSFGAGLSRFLRVREIEVPEVGRPKRRDQHRAGKSDPIDAELAARAVLAGTAIGEPKGAHGEVEMIRVPRSVRRTAVKARAQAANQLKGMLVTAPEELRAELRGLSTIKLVLRAARFRPGHRPGGVGAATKFALRSIARRYLGLSEEIGELDEQLSGSVSETAPDSVAVPGVGIDTAAALLTAVGEDPNRLKSESAFAHLCGVAPIPASSGKVVRYRLNRRGNRDANRALYMVATERMGRDERTQEYVARRTEEGKSKREIIRCLKRYIARELYKILVSTSSGDGILSENDPEEQEKRMKFNELLANSLILQNAVDITEALKTVSMEGHELRREDLAQLSPYLTSHVKRFGDYVIDLESAPEPLDAEMPALAD